MNTDIAGIGRSLALGLAAESAWVAVLARDRERAQLVVDEIGAPALERALRSNVIGSFLANVAPGLTDTPGMREIVGEEHVKRVFPQLSQRSRRPALRHRDHDAPADRTLILVPA